ncbi:MAG: transketolase family protein [Deltaproteobacteria bacterium]|nr:transketolase family protein [Deltaproteobacteria bacterium]
MAENREMRAVFGQGLEQLMAADDRIVLVDADLGRANGTLGIKEKFPDRAFNVGVAEQNMASIAAGLASYGFIPFINSFAAFASRRICDQITISIAYAKRNVKIVGTDPGIAAELNGCTHMAMEDIGVLRSIPGLVIFEPTDARQIAKALPAIAAYDGPVYIRLFRKVAPQVFGEDYVFSLFEADFLREGSDITLFATGFMVAAALKAAEQLAEQGISAEVINPHTIKPLDAETVLTSVRKTGAAVTCENHNIIGGLRSAVAEVVTESCPVPLLSVGVPDHFGKVSKLAYLQENLKMMPGDIVERALACLDLKARLRQ